MKKLIACLFGLILSISSAFAGDCNLFDVSTAEIQSAISISATGELVANSGTKTCITYIPVEPSTKYTISGQNIGTSSVFFRVAEYDTNKTFLSRSSDTGIINDYTFTTGATTKYIRFHTLSDTNMNVFQIETGNQTAYKPYDANCGVNTCPNGGTAQTYTSATGTVSQNGTPTPSAPVTPTFYTQGNMTLRAVGNIADSYDATTGKITRRVGVITFNGSESWTLGGTDGNRGVYRSFTELVGTFGTAAAVSTHFAYAGSSLNIVDMPTNSFSLYSNGNMSFKSADTTSVDGFKTWLSSHPVTIWYPLAEPVEETWTETTYCPSANTCNNLFNEIYPNPTSAPQYKAIYVGDGKFTCSYDLPYQQGNSKVSMVYFLPGNVSTGASNEVNQVDAEHPRTVTAVNGYVTVAYRNGSGIHLGDAVPTDYHCKIERGETATTYCKYNMIKLATTKYNTNAFSGVVTALSNAVDTIKTVVSNTINQATAVANLHSGKQTKPTDTCPNGKICLLVEDEAGTPHWYEIIERAPGIVPANSGYTQVEYLQSSGTQYIDTGVTDSVMKWDIVAQRTDESGGQMLLWGYGSSLGLYISNMETGGWNIRTTQLDGFKMDKVKLTHDRITGNVVDFYIDDVLKDHVTNCASASGSAYLFRANNAGNNIFFTGRVYSAQAYKDGSLVRDFVPARRNSDGVLGMYDTVSGNFFTNAGSGEFTAPGYLPSGYTQLQYIKASGTQYIDTGVVMTNDVSFTANVGTTVVNELGIRAGTGLVVWQGGNRFNFRYYTASGGTTNTQATNIPYTLNTMYNVGFNINKSSFSVDGQSIAKERDIYNAGAKIWTGIRDITASLKIWNNGVLVRDFVPVQRNSDGVLGLYNLLDTNPSTAFYTNAGTGEFTAGPVVQ